MRNFLASILVVLLLGACASTQVPATKLEKANILPLALNDAFQFRKQKLSFYGPEPLVVNQSEPVNFERARMEWGAVDGYQLQQRYGNYFIFFWRTTETADVTVRLEYRLAALGNHVMAQERYYPEARGSFVSRFDTSGDEYLEFGQVTSWRATLIVDGRIVALTQSFIWK